MMTCEQSGLLMHALIDGELDAGNAHEVESHLAGCASCAAQWRQHRALHHALAEPGLRYKAPQALRHRVEATLAVPRRVAPDRRSLLKGLVMGSMLSAAAAASVVVVSLRVTDEQRLFGEVVTAHLRSLQAEHLTDVPSSDRHTVKPWFTGRLDVAPPVPDLTAEGFRLIGGRLDYIDGKPIAAIIYKRRAHVINLFVAQGLSSAPFSPRSKSIQGFNLLRWNELGLDLVAISDVNADELEEFAEKFRAALRAGGA
jgi:anti-sigma factor RsiW